MKSVTLKGTIMRPLWHASRCLRTLSSASHAGPTPVAHDGAHGTGDEGAPPPGGRGAGDGVRRRVAGVARSAGTCRPQSRDPARRPHRPGGGPGQDPQRGGGDEARVVTPKPTPVGEDDDDEWDDDDGPDDDDTDDE